LNMETTRNTRRERVGVVTSNSMEKSIVIAVKTKIKHPIYGKFVNRTSKFMAHDEENTCNVGDTVKITETRPLSKSKRWRLIEIIERAK
jgi:small subunit ribosomal protein S17